APRRAAISPLPLALRSASASASTVSAGGNGTSRIAYGILGGQGATMQAIAASTARPDPNEVRVPPQLAQSWVVCGSAAPVGPAQPVRGRLAHARGIDAIKDVQLPRLTGDVHDVAGDAVVLGLGGGQVEQLPGRLDLALVFPAALALLIEVEILLGHESSLDC